MQRKRFKKVFKNMKISMMKFKDVPKMKLLDGIQVVLNAITIVLMLVIMYIIRQPEFKREKLAENNVTVKLQQPYFFLTEIPDDSLVFRALEYYEIKHPEIVLVQAQLETGRYKSKVCKENNNLFGLYNSNSKKYFKFKHWTESVEAYGKYIQNKYNGTGNYYHFLDSIGYAEDPNYIKKLKKMVK